MKRAILVVLFLFLSCAKKTVNIDLNNIDLSQVLKRVRETQMSVNSVKGLAYVSIKTPYRRISFNQVTIVKEPNLLRLEAMTFFGRTGGIVASDGAKVYVILPEQQGVFDNIEEFDFSSFYPELPVKFTVSDLTNFLLGRLPEEPEYEDSQVCLSVRSNYLVLTFFKSDKEENVLWVNPLTYRIEKAEINLDGGVRATFEFKDFKDLGAGVSFPQKIELKLNEFSISVKYKDEVEVNGQIDRSLFNLQPLARFEKIF